MSSRHNLLIVMGTYNEMGNLPDLLDEIWRQVPTANVLIVDDDSPDGTGKWCEERQRSEPRLQSIVRRDQRGLGSAIVQGLRWGIEHGFELMGTMDADFSHSPGYLPQLIERMHADNESADVVVGSRYCPGGSIVGWPWYRRCTSAILNSITRFLLRIPIRDSSGNYRLYRSCVLAPELLDKIQSNGYAYLEELLWLLSQTGATIRESPIEFTNRARGRSKISLWEPARKMGLILRLAARRS